MGAYQKESKPVKPAVQLIDQEAVIGIASQGLLALSLEIGCHRPANGKRS